MPGNSYFGLTNKNFNTRRKEYEKKRDEYARQQRLSAQQKIEDDYTQAKTKEDQEYTAKVAELNRKYGAAANNPEALSALQEEYATLESSHKSALKNLASARKESLAKTRDTKQYYTSFNEDTFDSELAKKEADTKSTEQQDIKHTEQQSTTPTEQQNTSTDADKYAPIRRYLHNRINTFASSSATDGPEMSARVANYNHAQNKADLHEQLANEEFKTAQKQSQISNRDPRREAGLDAATDAENKNAQKIANMGNASAGAAALERQVGDASQFIQPNRERVDTARKDSMQSFQQGYDDKQRAEQRREEGNIGVLEGYGNQISNAQTDILSMGQVGTDSQEPVPEQKEEPKQEPVPEQKEESKQEPPDPTTLNVDWQEVLNYITYANDPTSSHYGPGGDRRAVAEKYWNIIKQAYPNANIEPITAQELSAKGLTFDSGGQTQQFPETARPDFWALYQQGNPTRFTGGRQKNVGTNGYTQQALHEGAQQEVTLPEQPVANDTVSDIRTKNIKRKVTLNPNVTQAISDIKY